ncbi:MAG: universal stress protein [Chloroherpetonaceae bacterium]
MMTLTKILCPIDFTPYSENAIRYACEFARTMNAEVIFLNVIESQPYTPATISVIPSEFELEQNVLNEFHRLHFKDALRGVKSSERIAKGDIEKMILEVAEKEKVSFIILGTHARKGLERLLSGSVAETIVREANCPVMVVKMKERDFVQ